MFERKKEASPMATTSLSIKRLGVSVSAVLAVPYMVIMLASLFVLGVSTTGSWQAVFLGIGWRTIAGFEIGLLAVVIVGFAVAVVVVPTYKAVRHRATSQSARPALPSWAVRLLTACLVLPALTLVVLRGVAPLFSAGLAPGGAGANSPGSGARSQAVNMGAIINTAQREAEPSFTADGRTMYFNCNSGDICVSHLTGTWEAGNWTPPERLGTPISTEYKEVEPVITSAGDKLYFTSTRPDGIFKNLPFLSPFITVLELVNRLATPRLGRSLFGGFGMNDVWVSQRINGVWSEPQNLNDIAPEPHINTAFADHCLFFSADGNEAFWTSSRPGGYGNDDIWTTRRVDGVWSAPANLGPKVNGPGNDHMSIPTPDGQSLYITTTRAEGFGGEDIYLTRRGADGTWGALGNLGPPVNGPDNDRCLAWTPDGTIFLFDSVRAGGFGGKDIWWVYFKDVPGHSLAAVSASQATQSLIPRVPWLEGNSP
jgi:hypothetical protein